MTLNWLDVTDVPFEALLLLERVQLTWLPGWRAPEPALRMALAEHSQVAWYMKHKCPEIAGWVEEEVRQGLEELRQGRPSPQQLRQAEIAVLRTMVDLLVYALDPALYDAQPFTKWDSRELSDLVDFTGKVVLDIGAGTGRLTFVAAPLARVVFAVEPVGNLRDYMRARAAELGLRNVYPVDGLITRIPFPEAFADVVMAGHVFGDDPQAELAEMLRVLRPGGEIIFCPGSDQSEEALDQLLLGQGFRYSSFEEPGEGMKVKYWMTKG